MDALLYLSIGLFLLFRLWGACKCAPSLETLSGCIGEYNLGNQRQIKAIKLNEILQNARNTLQSVKLHAGRGGLGEAHLDKVR